jgi:hypothetical protein
VDELIYRFTHTVEMPWMMLDGVIATLVGLGLPLLAAWLLAGKLIA